MNPEGEALDLKNKLTWPDYHHWRAGEAGYRIYKQLDSSFYREIGQVDSASQSFIDNDLADSVKEFCYYIRANGFNEGEYSRSTKICLKQSPVVHFPNVFSPGVTAGNNDKFGPEGLYIKNYTMKIYNQFGQQVYKTTEGEKWDGRFEGELVPQGAYSYVVILKGYNGIQEEYQGNLTVIR